MDPTQCYREMNEGDWTIAHECMLALQARLDRGGICPPGHGEAEVRAAIADVLSGTVGVEDESKDAKEGGDT